jgi:DNA-binding NarL/FixJ family response regulator
MSLRSGSKESYTSFQYSFRCFQPNGRSPKQSMDRTRLVIIDEHEAVRQALISRLQQTGELEVVGSTGSIEEGLLQVEALRPNVVLLETKRSDGMGLETCRRIVRSHSDTTVIVLTSYEDEEERQAVYMAGAARYILKDIDSAQLLCEILDSYYSPCKNDSSV